MGYCMGCGFAYEMCERCENSGVNLSITARHWSAYHLREDPDTGQAGSSEEGRPRRFCDPALHAVLWDVWTRMRGDVAESDWRLLAREAPHVFHEFALGALRLATRAEADDRPSAARLGASAGGLKSSNARQPRIELYA